MPFTFSILYSRSAQSAHQNSIEQRIPTLTEKQAIARGMWVTGESGMGEKRDWTVEQEDGAKTTEEQKDDLTQSE